jgi:DNA repair protein RadD
MLTPRKYQREAIDSIYRYYEDGHEGNVLVCLPTGSGKSLVIAIFLQEVLSSWPGQNIIILTHVKELIEQNEKELLGVWPSAPVGVYSAGLNRKQAPNMLQRITFAGIQSVFSKSVDLGAFDLILVDEAHLIPVRGEGMYRTFLEAQKGLNSQVKVIGLTATPYRLGHGLLTEGTHKIFDDICYDKNVGELVREGYLCKLISKGMKSRPDLSTVKIRGGEYVSDELSVAVDQEYLVKAAVRETVEQCADRKSWLLFCTSVKHAQHVAAEVRLQGFTCEVITGDLHADKRDDILNRFKRGLIHSICNVGVLTTGFNHPALDAIIMLRPTKSTSLYVQMLGRGMRNAPGKLNCLVLDFSGNVAEHGPIDMIQIKQGRSGQTEVKKAPVKECPQCQSLLHVSVRLCPDCAYEWPERELRHDITAHDGPVMGMEVRYLPVSGVSYQIHRKEGAPPSVKVTYQSGLTFLHEWVCVAHKGYAFDKAWLWWRERMGTPLPKSAEDAVRILHASPPRVPSRLRVKIGGKYPEIEKVIFEERG